MTHRAFDEREEKYFYECTASFWDNICCLLESSDNFTRSCENFTQPAFARVPIINNRFPVSYDVFSILVVCFRVCVVDLNDIRVSVSCRIVKRFQCSEKAGNQTIRAAFNDKQ